MFGLLKAAPSIFRQISDFDVYQAHYCGLCQSLSEEYGQLSRFVTNYEVTLMYIFLTSIRQEEIKINEVRCPVSIFKKNSCVTGEARIAADISILLFNEKILDDEFDEKKKLPTFLKNRLVEASQKAQIRLQSKGLDFSYIQELMSQQRELEKNKESALDVISKPTSLMMEWIFEFLSSGSENKMNTEAFRTIGYYLGKWIYLMDSLIDLEKDSLLKRFNPILIKCDFSEKRVRIHEIPELMIMEIKRHICDCLHQVYNAINSLCLLRHQTLIADILSTGLQRKVDIVFEAIEKNSKNNRKKLKILQASTAGVLIPEVVFASNGSGQSCESCVGPFILCGIVAYGFKIMFSGCCGTRNSCIPCDNRPETIQVDSGCGGKKKYKKGCDGHYKEDNSCC